MIELKLAQYNLETGKLEGFLEVFIAKIFVVGNESGIMAISTDYDNEFKKDEKDPLNRFNGLFDGRTYGEGKFVLIQKVVDGWQDEIQECFNQRLYFRVINYPWGGSIIGKTIGNLHENPELYEKIK